LQEVRRDLAAGIVYARRMASTLGLKIVLRLRGAHSFELRGPSAVPWKRGITYRANSSYEWCVALLAGWPVVGRGRADRRSRRCSAPTASRSLDDRLDRADERGAHLHALGQRVVGAARRPAERLLEVRDRLVALGALDLAHRFLVVLGHVDVTTSFQFLRSSSCVLGRGLLADFHWLASARARRERRAEREHAEPVAAGGDHAGGVITLATAIGKCGSV